METYLKGSDMWKRLVRTISSLLFGSEFDYRVNYVLDNIDRLDINQTTKIPVYSVKKYKTYARLSLKSTLAMSIEVYDKLDTDTYKPLDMSYALIVDSNSTNKLIDFIDNGDGLISNNFRDELKEFISIIKKTSTIMNDIDRADDIDLQFNYNILRTYIITMESIVNSLYTTLRV